MCSFFKFPLGKLVVFEVNPSIETKTSRTLSILNITLGLSGKKGLIFLRFCMKVDIALPSILSLYVGGSFIVLCIRRGLKPKEGRFRPVPCDCMEPSSVVRAVMTHKKESWSKKYFENKNKVF